MKKLLICSMVLLASIVAEPAHASLSFDPSNTFSGISPIGSLTADFTDVAGGVQLVITSNLATGENLDPGKALYFNINPVKDSIVQNLSFTLTGNTNFNQQATVLIGADSFKADGDGYYDINFTFNSSTKAFTNGESQTYKITTSSGTISASDFVNYLSSTGGGNGNWLAAVHVQNTPAGGSGSAWIGATVASVPIPTAAYLFGPGLLLLMATRNRMNQA